MQINRLAIMYPSGNKTALVFDEVPLPDFRQVNDFIQEKDSSIEQVMFVSLKGDRPCGLMAGGEFCGNATRSLGYYLLHGKSGSIDLQVSGCDGSLKVTVHKGKAKTQMPFFSCASSVEFLDNAISVVHLSGISHLVLAPGSMDAKKILTADSILQKELAKELLTAKKLIAEPACGVMALADNDGILSIHPYVYVKQLNAICSETACGSGSLAVGLVQAKQRQMSLENFRVRQPSGDDIAVNVSFINRSFAAASIDGKMSLLFEGSFPID